MTCPRWGTHTPASRPDPFPGLIAHSPGPGPGAVAGHGPAFHAAVIEGGLDASAYFAQTGVAELASRSGGLCSLWFDGDLVIYQNTNKPLTRDTDLTPSINTNAGLFGSFMGGLDVQHPDRAGKRRIVESVLGNAQLVESLTSDIASAVGVYLRQRQPKEEALDSLCLNLTAYVDSVIPGILDLRDRPLTEYLASNQYGDVARSFFEIASQVISKMDARAIKNADMIVSLTRQILLDNVGSIQTAPASNLIKAQFGHHGSAFSRDAVLQMRDDELKELGTLIIATYDTTALSLLWTIAYLETTPAARLQLTDHLSDDARGWETARLLVLESIRLGGSNPTALWRRSKRNLTISHEGRSIAIPAGTMFWLDRRLANRCPRTFAAPTSFDTSNILGLIGDGGRGAASLLSRNRYEINSFSMVNTERNPRKCPGRIFSVHVQTVMLTTLYSNYNVVVNGVVTALMPGSAMPRPANPGMIRIEPLHT